MRHRATFPIDNPVFWKEKLLHWVAGFDLGAYLDSNGHNASSWECLAAADAEDVLETPAEKAFEQLKSFRQRGHGWLFGFFGYDLKNDIEALSSQNPDFVGFPDLGFFRPKIVVLMRGRVIEIQSQERFPDDILEEIKTLKPPPPASNYMKVELRPRIPKPEYLETVETIRQHILRGDVYEMNFCQEFFAEQRLLDPVDVFERLNQIGKAPFATFLKWRDRYLLSASPERFLKKTGDQLMSQPIKGTRRRGKSAEEDERIKQELAASEKDRSENVMIVDLVRNDFSRNCLPGTVRVDELCEIYSFETVHQMISTISGTLPPEADAIEALRDAFPMGSMTGAPKVMAMELIERYERTRRGLYSGAVGYVAPDGDFDFNVVIRSILYNAAVGYVSAQVGGAIVYDSVPEQEYEECLVKAEAMMRALLT